MTNEIQQNEKKSLTLSGRLALKRYSGAPAILCDTSGSMWTDVEPGQSRIDVLRSIVKELTNALIMVFNSDAKIADKNSIPDPLGGTYISKALQLAKDNGILNVILLTDGENEISDNTITLEIAKGMNIRIMYIGSGERPEFLNKLANQSGSFATTEDLKKPKEIKEKIQLLLGDGKQEKKGTICL